MLLTHNEPTLPKHAVLPPGSLVLVTGVSGFLACLVADELLAHGYRVRGTVRDLNSDKAAWIQPYFDERYGEASFEITQAKDLSVPNCLDEAADGCSGVVHVASVVTFDPDPNNVIPQSESFVENAFEAAMKVKSIQRFVFTSSSTAATQSKFNEVYDLTDQSWNDEAVTKAWASPPYTQDRMMDVYAASKVQSEQKLWKLVKERKPHFVVNTVLPDFLAGLPVNMDKQGLVTSNGALKWMWDGQDGWQMLYPQFMIDARDCALLHVAALVHPHLESERVFGYAHNKTWTDWIARLKRMYPEHAFPDPPPNEGKDLSNIVGQEKAEDLLKWLGKDGWRPMEDSMREIFDAFV